MCRARLLILVVAVVLPGGLDAQPVPPLDGAVEQADLLYFGGGLLESLELLEGHLQVQPRDYHALWRAARSALVLGISEEESEAQNRWLEPAIEFGDRAVAERAEGIDGIYWRGASIGRRALNAGGKLATELAQRVYDDAHRILAVDPTHGGAHNLLGKLNYEVMSLSRIERALGRLLMGNAAMSDTSWENAEEHLSEATKSWPELILFRFDLAQLYKKRGREEEATNVLNAMLQLPSIHPPDDHFKASARRLLEEIGR
jgi:tetratricopeptide (TPR) repeat protein